MKYILTTLLAVCLFSASAPAEEVILEKQGKAGNTSTRITTATCTALNAAPKKAKAPKGDTSAWAELKIKENTFLLCVISRSDNESGTTTAGLYIDRDGDKNLKEERPLTLNADNKANPKTYSFDIKDLPFEFKTAGSKLKLKTNIRLLHYDYGNRNIFYVYMLDKYRGTTKEFKMDWEIVWVPGTEPTMQLVNSSETANLVYSGRKQIHLSLDGLKISRDKVRLRYKLQKNRNLVPVKVPEGMNAFFTSTMQPPRASIMCLPVKGHIFLAPGQYGGKSAIFEKKQKDDIWRLDARVSTLTVADKGTQLAAPEPLRATVTACPQATTGTVTFSPVLYSNMGSAASLLKIEGEPQIPFIVIKDENGNEVAREEARIGGYWLHSISWQVPEALVAKPLTAELEFEKSPFRITFEKTPFIPTSAATGSASGVSQKEELDPEKLNAIARKVNEAIEKGAKFLISRQQANGSFEGTYSRSYPLGYNALCALTLVKCGVSLKNPAVGKAYGFLAKQRRSKTYSVAIYLMALEAKYYNKKTMKKIIDLRKKKKKKKYSTAADEEEIDEKTFRPKIHPADRALAQKLVDWLVVAQAPNGCWSYGKSGGNSRVRGDNSNMQYAVLGLKAGCRLGAKVPANTFLKNLNYLLVAQDLDGTKVDPFPIPAAHLDSFEYKKKKKSRDKKKGPTTSSDSSGTPGSESRGKYTARGWGYSYAPPTAARPRSRSSGTGSMTAAGLASVIICKSELLGRKVFGRKLRAKTNVSIEDGSAWFAANLSIGSAGSVNYYAMYGLERAGSLAGVRKFGARDWYYEGIEQLLPQQKPDGYWDRYTSSGQSANAKNQPKRPVDLCETCFALLFLKRATVRVIKGLDEDQIWTGKNLWKKKKKKEEPKKPGEEKKEGESKESDKKEPAKAENTPSKPDESKAKEDQAEPAK